MSSVIESWDHRSYQESHEYYMRSGSYIARKEVLAETTWTSLFPGHSILCDSGGIELQILTVVGMISQKDAYLETHGDYQSGEELDLFANAHQKFTLVTPHVYPQYFQEDFRGAYNHLKILEGLSYEASKFAAPYFLTEDEEQGPSLHFSERLFRDVEDIYAVDIQVTIEELQAYPMHQEYQRLLRCLEGKYGLEMPFGAIFKDGRICPPNCLNYTLPGTLAEITFSLLSSARNGMVPKVSTIKILSPE